MIVALTTLLGITGVLAGMQIIGRATPRSGRELAGAILLLTSVLLIPASAIVAVL